MSVNRALLVFACATLACTNDGVDPDAGATDTGTTDAGASDIGTVDTGTTDAGPEPPLELTTELCEDPNNLDALVDVLAGGGDGPSFGEINQEQVQRMLAAPTVGPFYMVNLIRFREQARYPDGRPTNLTGREANALYSPTEFIEAIGARPVFVGDVTGTTDNQDGVWDQVAIVEYPCPLALFAMSAHPEFQARSIHKEAGVEATIVMVTYLEPLGEVDTSTSPFPPTQNDPSFEFVQVLRFQDSAQFGAYTSSVSDAEQRVGIYPKARLQVQGVFIGDGRAWDEVRIDFVPSGAAYDAFVADPEVVAVEHLRAGSVEEGYGLRTSPVISAFPDSPDRPTPPPVTADGTGTLCQTDTDCPGNGVDKCLIAGGPVGFCTREGCGAGECESPYACCHDCSEIVASMLPFEGSACFPDNLVSQLTAAPVSCTCD